MNFLMLTLLQAADELLEPADTTAAAKFEEAAGEAIEYLTSTPVNQIFTDLGEKALHFGLKVLAAIVIYIVGAWIIKWIKKLMKNMFERRETDKAVSTFLTSLVSITLTVILLIVTIGALGINTTSIAALLAAGGVAIGMALSGTMQNFAGGIMIIVFKPFKIGDFITAQGYSGTVTHVSIVSTTITTVDNRCIILPNGSLSSGTVDNYSQNPLRRVDITVDVEYGSDAEKVKEVLTKILESDPRVLHVSEDSPVPADPFVALSALKDSSIEFVTRSWVNGSDYWGAFFALNEKIYTELPKKGINFPFPQMDVHLKKE